MNITSSMAPEDLMIRWPRYVKFMLEVADVGARVLGCYNKHTNGIGWELSPFLYFLPHFLWKLLMLLLSNFMFSLGLNSQEATIGFLFLPKSSFQLLLKAVSAFFAEYLKSTYTYVGPLEICVSDDVPSFILDLIYITDKHSSSSWLPLVINFW